MDIAISYVIPAHNSADVIEDTVELVSKKLTDVAAEIVVVENGSTDSTSEVLHRLSSTWPESGPRLKVTSSAKGLGNALRHGIMLTTGEIVICTADDLPFGFDDLDAAHRYDMTTTRVVIGSKAHRGSDITRSAMRTILSSGYRALLRLTLGLRTGDPQGTYVLDGPWARAVVPSLTEPGYLLTTEIAWAAELLGTRPVEVPVRLREARHSTRINPVADSLNMAKGLIGMRRRRKAFVASLALASDRLHPGRPTIV